MRMHLRMSIQSLHADIAKLRREQPRNPTSLAVCRGAEDVITELFAARAATQPKPNTEARRPAGCPACAKRRAIKAASMRRYRKARKARSKK